MRRNPGVSRDLSNAEADLVEVADYGEIGAGTVVPFTPSQETVTVLIPRHLAKPEEVGTYTVRGSSLEEEGIYDGDRLVFRTNGTNKDVHSDTICIVRINATGELIAKKVVRMETGTGKVALRSSGGGFKDRYYDGDDIQVIGIVFAMQRLADKHGRLRRIPEDEVPL